MKTKNRYFKNIEFSNHKLGLYDVKTFIKDWGSEPRRGVAEGRSRIVKKNGDKVLEITIPRGTLSDGGSFWRLLFPKDFLNVTFEYDVLFGKNFDFVRGGKLPGIGGGLSNGCGATPDEYQNGFSARLMWRVLNFHNKHLIKDSHKAYLVQYMYYPDRHPSKKFGEDLIYRYKGRKIFVKSNKWYKLKTNIKLSENPKRKDTITAYVNGKMVLNKKLNLRKKTTYGINQIMFSLFFGGGEPSWATKKKEKIYFKKFIIEGK
ncbi:MAG: hypothetical protein FJY98_01605 [Candidatus Liptonbacteria bacterium]|nr:hypothetical protein [Candidatus Liptonbacteria bacterium]